MPAYSQKTADAIAASGIPMSADVVPEACLRKVIRDALGSVQGTHHHLPPRTLDVLVERVTEALIPLPEQRAEDVIEYGIRIPDGEVLLDGDATDRRDQEARLDRYRGKALWPDAVLVQRPVFHGEWTEVAS